MTIRFQQARQQAVPALISLSYLGLSGLWISFSDRIGAALFTAPEQLTRFQTFKGFTFIAATALVMYLLLRRRRHEQDTVAARGEGAPLGALLILLVLATALPLLLMVGWSVHREASHQVDKARDAVQRATDLSAEETLAFLEQHRRAAHRLINRPMQREPRAGPCDTELRDTMAVRPEIANILLLEGDGSLLCSAVPLERQAAELRWVPRIPGRLTGPPVADAGGGWTVPLAFALQRTDGRAGWLELHVKLAALDPRAVALLPEGSTAGIVDSRGYGVARAPRNAGRTPPGRVSDAAIVRHVLQERSGSVTMNGSDGVERLYTFGPIGNTGLYAVTGVPVQTMYEPARRSAVRLGLSALAVCALAAWLVLVISRRISDPVRALTETAHRVASGQFDRRAPEGGPREIAEVARGFNRMLDRLPVIARLEEANRALDAFTYTVAHDLRGPVTTVNGFAHVAAAALARGDVDKARGHTERIVQSTQTMADMIDGLLRLARAGEGALQRESVDTAEMVEQVLRDLPTEGARVRTGPLPRVQADAVTLRQVWANLWSNALKYSGRQADAEVRVAARRADQGWVFSVADNGPGFDPAEAGQLFGTFQRLPGARGFDGTGVGLAIVKRIVERHGGRAWAEGRPGAGATFYFSLPDAESQAL
jgi:signal transduction histidine kinase